MAAMSIDKGWLSGAAGSFVRLNSITALRIGPAQQQRAGFDVDALVQGQWIGLANFAEERAATERVEAVLTELKHLFRYGN